MFFLFLEGFIFSFLSCFVQQTCFPREGGFAPSKKYHILNVWQARLKFCTAKWRHKSQNGNWKNFRNIFVNISTSVYMVKINCASQLEMKVTVTAIDTSLKLLNQFNAKLKPIIIFSLTFSFTSGCFIMFTFSYIGLIVFLLQPCFYLAVVVIISLGLVLQLS